MLRIRKIDYYGQLILISCTVLSISFFYFVGVGIGLFLLACWQLISALANTTAFIQTGYEKQILLYWTFFIAYLSLITLLFLFENDLTEYLILLIFWITIGAALSIAIYYLKIYYRLIELLFLRNELEGLTKSKH
jgi:hypothetical protein